MMWIVSLIAGGVFGAGLTISGMVNPQKVLNFLDVAAIQTGGWDPTLGVVFASATGVMAITYLFQRNMTSPLLAKKFYLPTRRDIDTPLVAGAVLFGVGWGLAGVCPGPAIAALATTKIYLADFGIFIAALLVGIVVRMATRADIPPAVSPAGSQS